MVNGMKKRMRIFVLKSLLSVLLIAGFSVISKAQSLSASVSRNPVGLNEQFQLTFTLDGSGSSFRAPALNEFMILSGPNQSTSMQIINGAISQSLSFTYILQPKKEGTFKIGAATMESGGKTVSSTPFSIRVVSGSGGQSQQQKTQDDKPNVSSNNIFIRVSVNKTSVYRGEALVATFKLYTNVQVVNYSISKPPAFNGFWSQDIEMPTHIKQYNEVFNGTNYQVGEIKKVVLYPQQSGELIIEPMEGECIARIQVKRNRSGNPFDVFNDPFFNDPFFGSGGIRDVRFAVKSDPVRIKVKELPSPAPESFKGTVGRFKMDAILDKNSVKTNDAVSYRIKINGKGNINLAEAPEFETPQDIEKYDPKVTDNIVIVEGGASGTRTFEFLLIPRHRGKYELEPIEFTYFDLDKKDYVTLTSPAFTLDVEKGKDEGTSASLGSRSDFRIIGRDIRFIKTGSPSFNKTKNYFNSWLFWILSLLPVGVLAGLAIWRRKYLALSADVAGMRSRKANRMAGKRLSTAGKLLQAGNRDGFYDEAGKAIWSYISDRFTVPVASLSRENAINAMLKAGVSNEAVNDIMLTVDHCEFSRFARMEGQKSPEQVLQDTISLITRIEDEIRI